MSARRWSAFLSAALLTGTVFQAAAAAPAPTSGLDVQVAEPALWFSPNGDAHRDRARVRFSLGQGANVSVLVQRGERVVRGPVRLGHLDAGRHAWTWDGRRGGGAPVKDGTFSIVVRATRDVRTAKAVVTAHVDRVADAGRLVTTRPTVYPKASIVSDRVGLVYLSEGWNAEEAQPPVNSYWFDDRSPLAVSASVVDSSGRVVWRREWSSQRWWEDARGFTFGGLFWYARGSGGEPVPAGTYDARVRVTDAAGNVATYGVPVAVSHQQLRRETWTSTVPAASATRGVPPGCGDRCTDGCSPVASARFAGGLSFASCPDVDSGTRAYFTSSPAPVVAAPEDSYRITATGGPSTAGSDDVGVLSGYVQLGPGDTTAATPWTAVELDAPPYLPDQRSIVPWGFSTHGGDAYDVASFTVEYRYYVPVD